MKKRLFSILLAMCLVICVLTVTAFAEETNVAKIGGIGYSSLQAAFNSAENGDTVTLLSDITLAEQVMIENNSVLSDITLDGNGNTIYDGVPGSSTICFGSNGHWATGVKIKNLTVAAAEGNNDPYCAIRLYGGTSSELTNVKVEGNYTYGINFYGTHGATLDNCQIVSAWTNGQYDNPLKLTNGTVIGTLWANDAEDSAAKVFIDNTSGITTLYAAVHTEMIDANSMDRIGTIYEMDTEGPMAAEVNGVQYLTLAAAVAAAEDGDTVTLLNNATLTSMVTIPTGKNVTLDLNGKTLNTSYSTASGNDCVLCVAYGADLTIKDSVGSGTIDGSSVYGAVKMTNTGDNAGNGTAKLTIDGGTLKGNYYAVVGNGGRSGTEITINGGTLTATQEVWGYGVFHPQNGTLTVNGGTIEAATGIEMRAGTLAVNGGEIRSTATELTTVASDSGTTVSGAAIALSQHTTNHPISVAVNGGSLSGPYAFYQDRLTKKTDVGASTQISATIDADVTISGEVKANENGLTMNGSADAGYALAKTAYSPNAVAAIGSEEYDSLAAAVNAAEDGDTVTVLKDTELGTSITVANDVTIVGADDGVMITANVIDALVVDNGGSLTLGENITITSNVGAILYADSGTIIVDGTTLNATGSDTQYTAAAADMGGAIVVKSGSITSNGSIALEAYNQELSENDGNSAASVTVEGGTVQSINNNSICAYYGGTVSVTDGEVIGDAKNSDGQELQVIHVDSASTASISGGMVAGTLGGDDTIEITGGTFTVDPSACVANGYIVKTEGTYTVLENKDLTEGTYLSEPDAASGYVAAENADGTWTISKIVVYVPSTTKPVEKDDKCDGTTADNCPAVLYSDVDTSLWYHEAIDYALTEGLMNGMTAATFEPNGGFTRAMMWTVLARQAGVDTEGGEMWYSVAQEWAMANGVSDGTDPDGKITREQLVTMLWRYVGEPEAEGDLSDFVDGEDVSDWAEEAMIWAVANKVIGGRGNGILAPQGLATRAEVAQIFKNYFE